MCGGCSIFSPLKPLEITTSENVWNMPVPKLEKGTEDISIEIIRDKEVMLKLTNFRKRCF